MAGQLWLGDDACVSHASAAALWGFPPFAPGPVELSTTRPKKPLPPVVVHKLSADPRGHTTTVGPLRVLNAGRTLVDIAGSVSTDVLERCVEDALRRRLTSTKHLHWLLGDRYGKGAAGISTLRRLLDSRLPGTESEFEVRLLQALRRSSLPSPLPQYEIFDGRRFIARVDFAYPWAKVAIEADSYQFHSGREAWERDLKRRNALTAVGWLVIHVTYRQLEEGLAEVTERVRDALLPAMNVHK